MHSRWSSVWWAIVSSRIFQFLDPMIQFFFRAKFHFSLYLSQFLLNLTSCRKITWTYQWQPHYPYFLSRSGSLECFNSHWTLNLTTEIHISPTDPSVSCGRLHYPTGMINSQDIPGPNNLKFFESCYIQIFFSKGQKLLKVVYWSGIQRPRVRSWEWTLLMQSEASSRSLTRRIVFLSMYINKACLEKWFRGHHWPCRSINTACYTPETKINYVALLIHSFNHTVSICGMIFFFF